jgi:hypothetical protein
LEYIWDRVRESAAGVDTVLSFESNLTASFPDDRKYSYETRGQMQTKVYSREFSDSYNSMLDGQVERRMRSAVRTIGSYWYTAWVNAGQPDLDKFIPVGPSLEELEKINQELNAAPNPEFRAREHDN